MANPDEQCIEDVVHRYGLNEKIYEKKKEGHRQQAQLPIKEKMRILLELQKHDLPLLAARRPLKWWEKPWDVEP